VIGRLLGGPGNAPIADMLRKNPEKSAKWLGVVALGSEIRVNRVNNRIFCLTNTPSLCTFDPRK
jgi:hypothetical protein